MPALLDLRGSVFGDLTVVERARDSKSHRMAWRVQCSCGGHSFVTGAKLRSGNTKSCGCRRNLHGHSQTTTYRAWCTMRDRCTRSTATSYSRYGGRGISVCRRWLSYANFLADMGPRPTGRSIERIDNDGNYEPGNCHWATRKEQARNKRNTRLVTVAGRAMPVPAWAEELGVPKSRIYARLSSGWSDERAVMAPLAG